MPDSTVKDARPSVLRLPEMGRQQIMRALSEIHLPDLTKIDVTRIELPKAAQDQIAKSRADIAKIDIPKAVSEMDLPKAVSGPLIAAGLVKPKRRRWPYLLVGVVVAGIVATFLAKKASSRMKMGGIEKAARERADAIADGVEDATFDPLASNGMPHDDIAVAIQPGAFAGAEAETDSILVFEASDSAV
jgi:hypothetical protein